MQGTKVFWRLSVSKSRQVCLRRNPNVQQHCTYEITLFMYWFHVRSPVTVTPKSFCEVTGDRASNPIQFYSRNRLGFRLRGTDQLRI